MRILLIEETDGAAKAIETILHASGFSTCTKRSACAALDCATCKEVDLVLDYGQSASLRN